MINIQSEGILFILSSPSGAGKTTITHAINKHDNNTTLSISYTTRAQRAGEVQDKDYNFIDKDSFLTMVSEEKFIEYAVIYGNLYGTPKDKISDLIKSGKDVIFDIDWQGASTIKKLFPEHVVSVFILPPSLEILKQRLTSRATESSENANKRLQEAIKEIEHHTDYDFIVINDDLDKAIQEVYTILKSERLRRTRRKGIKQFITNM